MKYAELARKVKKEAGCRIAAHLKGHDEWYSPLTGEYFIMGRHGSQEVPAGTLNSILKAAGLKK